VAHRKTLDLKTEDGKRLAIEVIERTVQIPKNLDSVSKYEIYTYLIGVVYLDLKMYEKAAESFLRAIEINPQDADARNHLAVSLNNLQTYEDAIKSFDNAIEINPQDATTWSNCGLALLNQQKYEDAIKSFDNAIEISPLVAAWYNRG
jgi:tetratricopeptide (TPR) repeat protein